MGFADEVAAQLHSNNARFWAFQPHLPRKVNTSRSNHLFALSEGKTADIEQALRKSSKHIRHTRHWLSFAGRPVPDNVSTHRALQNWAMERHLYLIAIPLYSPDLNGSGQPSCRKSLEIS